MGNYICSGFLWVLIVSGYHGFGINIFYPIINNFPDVHEYFIFVLIAFVDSGTFKGTAELEALP
jgi:hypothetical protein